MRVLLVQEHPEIVEAAVLAPACGRSTNAARWGIAILIIALTPALAAIWTVPWFVTQDGSAHVYNAQILAWSFRPDSPFREYYTVHWQPIPNWAGHLAVAGLLTVLPAWAADRIMISVTLVGFGASILWLRWRVGGGRGMPVAAVLAALLAMNLAWLLGFTSFILGACLFPITLGIWWSGRDRLSARRIAVLSALLTVGYFCHLVSLGLTVLALVILAVASPPADGADSLRRRASRLASTSVSFLPLVILVFFYLRLAIRGGRIHPSWDNLADPFLPWSWMVQLAWVDPLTLTSKKALPFTDRTSPTFVLCAPVAWLGLALMPWFFGQLRSRPVREEPEGSGGTFDGARARPGSEPATTGDRRCWLALAVLLVLAGVSGPDSLGPDHGEYLSQRVILLGLVALVPIFDLDPRRWSGRAAIAALVIAVAFQSAIVWDYALYSDNTAGQIIGARPAVGDKQRIAALHVATRSRFRVNPLLHVENWLGVDNGNVVWNNYETRFYYFPVHFRAGIDRPDPYELEQLSLHEDPENAPGRLRDWQRLLASHHGSIDVLVVRGSERRLDEITMRWFDFKEQQGDVRIFKHKSEEKGLEP